MNTLLQKFNPFKKKIIVLFFYFIISILFLELIARVTVYIHFGKLIKTSQILNSSSILNVYTKMMEKESNCITNESVILHPYLAWVHTDKSFCKKKSFNNYGFIGPDLPDQYNANYYSILITGGSVSQQFGPGRECNKKENVFCRNFLGEQLKDYVSIDGRKIRIFNAGNGAYKHPQQVIISLLHGHLFDLVISIEGFNEHYSFVDKEMNKLSKPANTFKGVSNYYNNQSFLNNLIVNSTLKIKKLIFNYQYLQKSYFVSIIYHGLRSGAEKIINIGEKNEFYDRLFAINTETNFKYEDKGKEYINNLKYDKLEHYWKSFLKINSSNKTNSIIFLQPVPFIEKKLTKLEQEVTEHPNYVEIFKEMEERADKLFSEGYLIYSLFNIFKETETDVYLDAIHLNTYGNTIMAKNIKNILKENQIIKLKSNQ